MNESLLAGVLRLRGAGLATIPIKTDGSKCPALTSWKVFEERLPTEAEVRRWYGNGKQPGVALVGGKVSGNLEILDFDAPELIAEWRGLVEEHAPGLLDRLPQVQTPAGGLHVFYRCDTIEGNKKLAEREVEVSAGTPGARQRDGRFFKVETMIETRGEGGYVITDGSPAACHPLGKIYRLVHGDLKAIPTITAHERDVLLTCARALNEFIKPSQQVAPESGARPGTGLKPGEDFSRRGDVHALLEKHDWKRMGKGRLGEKWQRPGGDHQSATLFESGNFYVFSSNAYPLEPGCSYSPFALFATLEHNGDFQAAAKDLGKQGYGEKKAGAGVRAPQRKRNAPEKPKDQANQIDAWEETQTPGQSQADAERAKTENDHRTKLEGLRDRLNSGGGKTAFEADVIAALAWARNWEPCLFHEAKESIKAEGVSLRDLDRAVKLHAERVDGASPDDGESLDGWTIAQQLIAIAVESAELFQDDAGNCYASLKINEHKETHKLNSRDFKDWLTGQLYAQAGKVAGGDKVNEAISVLRAKARYEGPKIETHVRVAEHGGAIYLDLCDRHWRQVEITVGGWRAIESEKSPVRFRRAGGTLPLPEPVRGGELGELRELLNLPGRADGERKSNDDEDNWCLTLAWLIAALKPANESRFAFPLLAVHGEQGSGKSTYCRDLRRLIDPNKANLRSAPRDERDLAIAAEHGRVISFDNLTHISESLSNALCRLATGGGFATRELFTDEGEVIFDAQRPVILNGISEVVAKSDLLERSILLYLPRIPREKRKLERLLDRDFKERQPRILGALLDAVSAGLKRLRDGVEIDEFPRMADFYEWAIACEESLGLEKGSFKSAYLRNQEKANGLAIEASPVAQTIVAMIDDCELWEGPIGALLKGMNSRIEASHEDPKRKPGWPQSARSLGAKLKEIAPNLRRNGIEITLGERSNKGRLVTLMKAKAVTQGQGGGKDVHNVHNVHPVNEINGLDGEHRREHLESEPPRMFTGNAPNSNGEHCDAPDLGNVHVDVHGLNPCEQSGSEHREHREHLSEPSVPPPQVPATAKPANRKMSL